MRLDRGHETSDGGALRFLGTRQHDMTASEDCLTGVVRGQAVERRRRRWRSTTTRRSRCSASSPTACARGSTPDGIVTYIIDRNVNYTNICVARCNFCAFYRPVGSRDGYVLGFEEIFRKIDETIALGGVQLLLQGGHNPDLPIEWYEDLFRAVKQRYPTFKLHALSPPEVIHISRLSRLSVPQVIERLDRRRPRQRSRRRRRDSRRSRAQAAELLRQGDRRRMARRDAPRASRGAAHDGDDDVRARGDRRGAPRAPAAARERCRTRPAASPRSSPGAISPSTPSSAVTRRPGSSTSACSRSRASSSTTSRTCRRRG